MLVSPRPSVRSAEDTARTDGAQLTVRVNPLQLPLVDQRVIILNGPAGVGKTTTARALAELSSASACIHGDELRKMIVNTSPHVRGRLAYTHGALLASSFIHAGYELVIFDYVFECEDPLETFFASYSAKASAHFFTLWAPFEVVRRREAARPGRERLGSRVEECYRAIEARLDHLGPVVDISVHPPERVAAELLSRCLAGDGLPDRRRMQLAS